MQHMERVQQSDMDRVWERLDKAFLCLLLRWFKYGTLESDGKLPDE